MAPAITRDGMTALHYAALAGHFDVAEVLLRYHSDVNALDNHGRTPLMEACHAGPWKSEPAEAIIQLLLDHNAEIDLFQAAAMANQCDGLFVFQVGVTGLLLNFFQARLASGRSH